MTDATPDAVDPRFDPRFQRGYDPERHGGGRRSALRSEAAAPQRVDAPAATAAGADSSPATPRPKTVADPHRAYARPDPDADADAAPAMSAPRVASPRPTGVATPTGPAAPAALAASASSSRPADAATSPADEIAPLHDDGLDDGPRQRNPFLIAIPVFCVVLLAAAFALFTRVLDQSGQSFRPGDDAIDIAIQQASSLFPPGLIAAALLGLIVWVVLISLRRPERARREPDDS